MKIYSVTFSPQAMKALKKLDPSQARLISAWIKKNLVGCSDPRVFGKPLTGSLSGVWRYRVGGYRILASILDDKVIIDILNVGHRREIYAK